MAAGAVKAQLATLGRPALMAIGDSIYNGVRSLTIHAELAALSPPAQVAGALGVPFVVPDYPRPVLFDLEEVLHGVDLMGFKDAVIANAQGWIGERPWSGHLAFDNLSCGGADIASLWEDTAGPHRAELPALLAKVAAHGPVDFVAIAHLWYAINVAFVLNPTQAPGLDALSPLDLVTAREPKALLINIGSNEGLFNAVFTGDVAASKPGIAKIPGLVQQLAARLAKLPASIGTIYFNNLIKPSTIANLMPQSDMFMAPGCGNYIEQNYIPRIGGGTGLKPSAMKDLDMLIADVNAQAKAILTAADPRIRIVDIYRMAAERDGKHGCMPAGAVTVKDGPSTLRLTNVPLLYNFLIGFVRGGLFGLDNMHPTAVGYAVLANAVLDAMGQPQTASFQAAYERDTLLQHPPRLTDLLQMLLGTLGNVGIFKPHL
jgi:hypothetical protein